MISVNTAGISAPNAAGTVYGGATSLLRASTPVTPGAHTVYLSVFDQGDSNYDSAAFLDRAVLTNTPPSVCKAGASSDVVAAGDDDHRRPRRRLEDEAQPLVLVRVLRAGLGLPVQPRRRRVSRTARAPPRTPTSRRARTASLCGPSTRRANADPTPASRSFTVKGGKQLAAPVVGEVGEPQRRQRHDRVQVLGRQRFRTVNDARQIDVGCTVDATAGRCGSRPRPTPARLRAPCSTTACSRSSRRPARAR